jgi:DNA invertase Pin-like site-specific DNA recombinase
MNNRNSPSTRTPEAAIDPTTAAGLPAMGSLVRSAKILDQHLDRLAVVYVRQSSPQQVLHHRESRERQYALANHAAVLGWPKDRILVIDDDQGQSAKTAERRSGFHRLLAEVTMEHVGLILGLDMSRLARSNKDWHQLLEMCALFGTILADEDGVYDPNDSNDRLLLGLKGTISEFELVTMHNRLERGKLNKALRGELFYDVPTGYVKVGADKVALDPDEQVRAVIHLIFDKYDELGTVRGVFYYLLENHISLGIRPFSGPRRGELEWRRPTMPTVYRILTHPFYAGVYTYKRRRRKTSGTATPANAAADTQLSRYEWQVFKRDRLPAYITWDRYLANQDRLCQHRCLPDAPGTPRVGAALLAGLVVCGNCGHRLSAHYGTRGHPSYVCRHHERTGVAQSCYGLQAAAVDDLVSQQVLLALEPAALQLSLQVQADQQAERARLDQHWKQRLERARYESQEAERRYRAVDPENRLVARNLERCWEEALQQEQQLAEEYDRFAREKPAGLSADDQRRIEQLAADIPALWHAADTTAADRKEIIRHLVERVVVQVRKESEYVVVTIHWQGGWSSDHEVRRPVRLYEHLRDHDRLMERLVTLWRSGQTSVQIAQQLNEEGFCTPRRQSVFSAEMVRQLLHRRGCGPEKQSTVSLEPDEWWMADLALKLRLPQWKLREWGLYGWLHYRQTPTCKRWIIWADREEIQRLRKLKARSKYGQNRHPRELTTPKERKRKK